MCPRPEDSISPQSSATATMNEEEDPLPSSRKTPRASSATSSMFSSSTAILYPRPTSIIYPSIPTHSPMCLNGGSDRDAELYHEFPEINSLGAPTERITTLPGPIQDMVRDLQDRTRSVYDSLQELQRSSTAALEFLSHHSTLRRVPPLVHWHTRLWVILFDSRYKSTIIMRIWMIVPLILDIFANQYLNIMRSF